MLNVFPLIVINKIYIPHIGGTNEQDGGNYIYSTQNYGAHPVVASILSVALVIGVPLLHVALVSLKDLILKKWIKAGYARTESVEYSVHVETVPSVQ